MWIDRGNRDRYQTLILRSRVPDFFRAFFRCDEMRTQNDYNGVGLVDCRRNLASPLGDRTDVFLVQPRPAPRCFECRVQSFREFRIPSGIGNEDRSTRPRRLGHRRSI
jgi:hypothetical protein